MMRAREFPRLESVSIEQVCPSRRQRRAGRGLGSGIVVVGKLIVLATGYYVAVYGGFFGGLAFLRDAEPNLALIFGIGGIVCTVGCVVAMLRVVKAVPWLGDESSVLGLVVAWFISITGLVCAAGFGVVVLVIVGGAP